MQFTTFAHVIYVFRPFCSFLWNSTYICIGCLFTKSLRTTYLLTLKCVWLTFKWMTDWQCLLLPFLRIIFAIFTPHICHFYAFYLPFLRLIFAIFTHQICHFYASYLPFLRIIFAIFMHHIWHFYASYLPFLCIIFDIFTHHIWHFYASYLESSRLRLFKTSF
jgi:hypothetical protein